MDALAKQIPDSQIRMLRRSQVGYGMAVKAKVPRSESVYGFHHLVSRQIPFRRKEERNLAAPGSVLRFNATARTS